MDEHPLPKGSIATSNAKKKRQNPIPDQPKKYSALFCSFSWPRHPGHAGGEIRDYHLLRGLLSRADVSFFSMTDWKEDNRKDLSASVASVFSPTNRKEGENQKSHFFAQIGHFIGRALFWLRRHHIPVIGPRYHAEISLFAPLLKAHIIPAILQKYNAKPADFLIVSPQLNPLALLLRNQLHSIRWILATYDVETVRLERMAQNAVGGVARLTWQLEAQRARHFEKDNLALYDGIIAVSDLDRQLFSEQQGIDPERVLVIENSVDTDYFSFTPRTGKEEHSIVFTGNLAYSPNDDAARRLLSAIMPLVRLKFPDSRAWIVGQQPSRELLSLSDGRLNNVTGMVEDVRIYFDQAAVACIPLSSGSGTKYKVLEAASVGVPVVCTSIALEGLSLKPETHLLLAEDNNAIAQAIIDILENPQQYLAMAHKARRHIEDHYSWDHNLDKLGGWLEKLFSLPKRSV